MFKTILGSLIIITSLAACGGDDGSGVDGSKTFVGLSTSERQTFCEWSIDQQGGAGHVTQCGDNLTVITQTVAECVASFDQLSASCAATVTQAEACSTAMADDACSFGGSACTAIYACFPQA